MEKLRTGDLAGQLNGPLAQQLSTPATKPRATLVGGKPWNVPKQLREHVLVVKHLVQETRVGASLPHCDYLLVLTNWCGHDMIVRAQKLVGEGTPTVYLQKGWAHMRRALIAQGVLPESTPEPPRRGRTPKLGGTRELEERAKVLARRVAELERENAQWVAECARLQELLSNVKKLTEKL